jgi:hypothetical protein
VTVPRDATFVVFIFDQAPPERPRLRGRALWRAWFAAVTVAEFVGFAVPATVGALTVSTSPWLAVPALLAAGAVEGAMLGGGQAAVLRQAVAGLPARWWVAATTAGAVLAYAIGMAPSTFGAANWPAAAFVALAVPGGAALLLSIGVAQWLVLRRHIPRAGRWIVATAAAWIVGLVVFLAFAMPLWQPGQPTVLVIAIGAVGGLLMAATVAAVTGTALRRILA